jgi:uncharacterized protein (TIGR03905 family)
MKYNFKTEGTCSQRISFDLEDGIVKNVAFTNGCAGNLSAIGKLVEGMRPDEVIAKLKGLPCGSKPTSCPDQLARALESARQRS